MAVARAAWQGLFNLFIEPLAQAIRQVSGLEGITIRDTEYKICLHADDVLVSLKKTVSGVPRLMDLLQVYGALSGYTFNTDKTQALVCNFTPSLDLKNKFTWDSTSIRYLGVNLTRDISELYS